MRIIVSTQVVTGTELNQIGVPRIDTCSYIELQMDDIPFVQNMEISKSSVIASEFYVVNKRTVSTLSLRSQQQVPKATKQASDVDLRLQKTVRQNYRKSMLIAVI